MRIYVKSFKMCKPFNLEDIDIFFLQLICWTLSMVQQNNSVSLVTFIVYLITAVLFIDFLRVLYR